MRAIPHLPLFHGAHGLMMLSCVQECQRDNAGPSSSLQRMEDSTVNDAALAAALGDAADEREQACCAPRLQLAALSHR